MELAKALRIKKTDSIAIVGAGGKTSALFQLARELAPCIVTTSTHLGSWQTGEATKHVMVGQNDILKAKIEGITLVTGAPMNGERLSGLDFSQIEQLHHIAKERGTPLLIEADGARQKPFKAPAEHEPAIPPFVDVVVVVAGLGVLGKAIDEENVFRSERLADLVAESRRGTDESADSVAESRMETERLTDSVTESRMEAEGLTDSVAESRMEAEGMVRVLAHPLGGLKNIPDGARRVVLLNQADTAELQATGGRIAAGLMGVFDGVVVASLLQKKWQTIERVAGIILAAGGARRFGQPKQLLDFHGKSFVRSVAEAARQAGLWPVIVVEGAVLLTDCLADSRRGADASTDSVAESRRGAEGVRVVHNDQWASGQASSIRTGLGALPGDVGAAIFLLADQPQVTVEVVRALVERHSMDLPAVLAPYVDDKRANPVLFDRVTFDALMQLQGDVGGRAIFSQFSPRYLNWYDSRLLLDVDTPEDYARLLELA
jgi:molybdenum cofactor cytidylyltransferase